MKRGAGSGSGPGPALGFTLAVACACLSLMACPQTQQPTPTPTAPGAPSGFTAKIGVSGVLLSWEAPSVEANLSYLLFSGLKASSWVPENGKTYLEGVQGDGFVKYSGPSRSFADLEAIVTTRSYTLFARSPEGLYSSAASLSLRVKEGELVVVPPGEEGQPEPSVRAPRVKNYLIYYGNVDATVLAAAKRYPLVIFHPNSAGLTRAKVAALQAGGTKVVLYISIGEDFRTSRFFNFANKSVDYTAMKADPRFAGDGKGPTVDPRRVGPRLPWPNGAPLIAYVGPGDPSPGGSGFASYYLDDISTNNGNPDGLPDFNTNWGAAFVNAGDPLWFETLDSMQNSVDGQYGMAQMLDSASGLGADGLFLDTIDSCAPNSWTASSSPVQGEFEWTAPGFSDFIRKLRERYPDKIIVQNRGLFFLNKDLPHYAFTTRGYIDYLLFESYRLDSDLRVSPYFDDNRYNYMPKLSAEASRADGFQILSLEYYRSGSASLGEAAIADALHESRTVAGFSTYMTDKNLSEANSIVLDRPRSVDTAPPAWSSTVTSYPQAPTGAQAPRIGLRALFAAAPGGATEAGAVYLGWDVAIDENAVEYVAYRSYEPISSSASLATATKIELKPLTYVGREYASVACYDPALGPYPFEAKLSGLESGRRAYIVLRARDRSPAANEDANLNALSIVVP